MVGLTLDLTALKWHGEAVRDVAVKRVASIIAYFRLLLCEIEPFNHGQSSPGFCGAELSVGGFYIKCSKEMFLCVMLSMLS
jgi:hypothetical protein